MKYRIRFLKLNNEGNERKLATAAVDAPTLADALRQVIDSLDQTRPDILEQVAGVRVIEAASRPPALVTVDNGGGHGES